MNRNHCALLCLIGGGLLFLAPALLHSEDFQRLAYNNPGLTVDLGVGLWAWPLPMDFDGDGDLDLVVSCPDAPYNGVYFFENTSGNVKYPVFKPGVRISKGASNVSPSYVDGRVRVLSPGMEYPDFLKTGLESGVKLAPPTNIHANKVRANQWKYVDYDGDGKLDLAVGVGDWTEYGWDNAFDSAGKWTRGPLHGYVYLLRNTGANDKPAYATPVKIVASGKPVDVFGMPSPNFADFDGDGDLDLICGEFLDGFTYFENTGERAQPVYTTGRRLQYQGKPLAMDLEMIVPVAIDWDKDGDLDLVVGQEDGRVALMENTGKIVDKMPEFLPPRFFQQQAADVKFGALITPVSFDWDGDGDEDLVCGNTAGYIGFIENLGGNPPKWAAPKYLEADGKTLRIMAGPNGSIQGPCEAKWGYTTLSVSDWDGDGLPDIIVNSIWGKIVWYRNIGARTSPQLAAAQPIEVEWPGAPPKPAWVWWQPEARELATQWRTTPVARDWNGDGFNDLIMLDTEGYLVLFERAKKNGKLILLPGRRVFRAQGGCAFDSAQGVKDSGDGLLRLNVGAAGGSGRRKFCIADWNGDGRPDLLVNSYNVNFIRNVSNADGIWTFRDAGRVCGQRLAGHDTSPTTVDWGKTGVRDLLVGAEDGYLYFLPNPARNPKSQDSGKSSAQPQPRKSAPEHLVAFWDFDAANGGPLADKATTGKNKDTLSLLGDAKIADGVAIAPGTNGSALRAKDSDDLSPSAEMTLYARVRVDAPPKRFLPFLDKRRFQNPESRAYGFYIPPSASGASFGIGGQISEDGGARNAMVCSKSKETLAVGRWLQVAMIVRNENGRLIAEWLAREDDPTTAAKNSWKIVNGPAGEPRISGIHHSDQALLIGNDANLKATGVQMEYDEIRFYNRALTTEELSALSVAKH